MSLPKLKGTVIINIHLVSIYNIGKHVQLIRLLLLLSVDAAHKCFVCRPSHADGTYATEISELRRHFR